MKNTTRRLDRREVAVIVDLDPTERATYRGLSESALVGACIEYPGDVSYLTGWFAISVDDRTSRALHEVGEIDAPSTDDPHELRAVLASWADEPDADGWPRLEAGPDSYAQFADSVTATRHRLDLMRGDVTRAASRLRADHPGWRPGMTVAEHDGFEVLVLVLG